MATGFVYTDPVASVFVGVMILATAIPLLLHSGQKLLGVTPQTIDVKGVEEDIVRIAGPGSVHDLHIWTTGKRSCSSTC